MALMSVPGYIWSEYRRVEEEDRKFVLTVSRDCKWCTSPHRSVGISVEENNVAVRKGQSLRKQNIPTRFLTGFTSKANSTCCMSGDTWYLAALDLSWMGYRQKYRHTHIRNTLSTAAADSKVTVLGENVLTNSWFGTTTLCSKVSMLSWTTSPSAVRYSSSLSLNEKQTPEGEMIFHTVPVPRYRQRKCSKYGFPVV